MHPTQHLSLQHRFLGGGGSEHQHYSLVVRPCFVSLWGFGLGFSFAKEMTTLNRIKQILANCLGGKKNITDKRKHIQPYPVSHYKRAQDTKMTLIFTTW